MRPWVLLAAAALCCGGGVAAPAPTPLPDAPRGEPIDFVCRDTQGKNFDSRATRGRATVILFGATFDLRSQALARRLDGIVRRQRPRVNAGAMMLEDPQNSVLADVFRTSLDLSYPVCIADAEIRAGEGPFGPVRRIPTLVVLDRSGVEVWRKEGLSSASEMKQALTMASRRGAPPTH
jgi:hypothetical protein